MYCFFISQAFILARVLMLAYASLAFRCYQRLEQLWWNANSLFHHFRMTTLSSILLKCAFSIQWA